MKKLTLKEKILFLLFAVFLITSAVLFNFEQLIFSVITLAIAVIFGILLAINTRK